MVYPNYYARRWTTAGWRRPGYTGWGGRSYYGSRPGYGWGRYGAGQGYRGGSGGRYWPRYGASSWQYRRNWPWRYGRGYGYYGQQAFGYGQPGVGSGQQGATSPWISWAQSCLAQVIGSWVPQNGRMGRATRHAIRKFQKQQQLPATGMLDSATINALQAACSGQAGAGPGVAVPPPAAAVPAAPAAPASDDVAAASAAASAGAPPDGTPPDGGGAPPDGGAPDGGAGPPPDAGAGELFMRGRRRRFRRRWGSGFNFQPPDTDGDDDDGELSRGGWQGRGRFWGGGRRWGTGFGSQSQDYYGGGRYGGYGGRPW